MLYRALAAASLSGVLLGQALVSIARMPFRVQGDDRTVISTDSFDENQDWSLDSDPVGWALCGVRAYFQEQTAPVPSAVSGLSALLEAYPAVSPRAPPAV